METPIPAHPNFIQSYLHGTKADLRVGDRIVPGKTSNYGERVPKFVYVTSNLNVAIHAAEMALGNTPGRIYVVEPVGAVEDDPNVTDKRFPGNPTRSFRAREGFTVVAEVVGWTGRTAAQIAEARATIDLALRNGAPLIEE